MSANSACWARTNLQEGECGGLRFLGGDQRCRTIDAAISAMHAQGAALAAVTRCPPEKVPLEGLAGDRYEADLLGRRVSVIDLLDRYQACELSFARLLDMLQPMRARQYSTLCGRCVCVEMTGS